MQREWGGREAGRQRGERSESEIEFNFNHKAPPRGHCLNYIEKLYYCKSRWKAQTLW